MPVKVNTPTNTKISFDSPEQFIGMKITKRTFEAFCIGYEPYTTKLGVNTFLLNWELKCLETGKIEMLKTSWNFRVGDIPARMK